jgi:hypothetical protein
MKYASDQQFVREQGFLLTLEHRIARQRSRVAFNGYASEEDVSQIGGTIDDFSQPGSTVNWRDAV